MGLREKLLDALRFAKKIGRSEEARQSVGKAEKEKKAEKKKGEKTEKEEGKFMAEGKKKKAKEESKKKKAGEKKTKSTVSAEKKEKEKKAKTEKSTKEKSAKAGKSSAEKSAKQEKKEKKTESKKSMEDEKKKRESKKKKEAKSSESEVKKEKTEKKKAKAKKEQGKKESKKEGKAEKKEEKKKDEKKEEAEIKAEKLIEDILSRGLISSRRKTAEGVKKIDGGRGRGDTATKTPFAFLLKEVSKYPLLSPEEEKKLALRFKKYKDKEAAKKLALANLRFVIKIALEYKNWGIPVEDLVSEGIIGLLFAIRKFDPDKGVKFISYASYWIKAFIHNYILSNFSIIKLGTTQDERRIFANIFKIRDETREEDIQAQAERLGVDTEKIKLMDARVRARDVSLDSPQDDEGSLKLADILKADESFDPLSKVEIEDARDFINKQLNDAFLCLTSQERQVIQQRYLSPRPKTLKELSDELKISKERIRQVERRAFQKLKTALSQYAQTFRIDMLKDKVRRKRRTREEMELAKMIEMHTRKRKKRKKRKSTKVEPQTTEFFDPIKEIT